MDADSTRQAAFQTPTLTFAMRSSQASGGNSGRCDEGVAGKGQRGSAGSALQALDSVSMQVIQATKRPLPRRQTEEKSIPAPSCTTVDLGGSQWASLSWVVTLPFSAFQEQIFINIHLICLQRAWGTI